MNREEFEKLQEQNPVVEKTITDNTSSANNEPATAFNVIEATKLNLQPNDTLMITIKHDDIDQESINGLKKQLESVFPNNKVFILAMGSSDGVEFSIISKTEELVVNTPVDTGYCSDCNCGKKESSESTV